MGRVSRDYLQGGQGLLGSRLLQRSQLRRGYAAQIGHRIPRIGYRLHRDRQRAVGRQLLRLSLKLALARLKGPHPAQELLAPLHLRKVYRLLLHRRLDLVQAQGWLGRHEARLAAVKGRKLSQQRIQPPQLVPVAVALPGNLLGRFRTLDRQDLILPGHLRNLQPAKPLQP